MLALHIAQSACAILALLAAIGSLYLMPSWRNVALLGMTIVQSIAILLIPDRYSVWRLILALLALVYINWNFRVLSAELRAQRQKIAELRLSQTLEHTKPKGDVRNN